jgi:hypothetical protein
VVKAEENLLLQSQTFETTWSSARLVIAANDTTAPDGTTTADKLTQAAGQTTSGVVFQGLFAPAVGQSYTLSIYAKAGTGRNFIVLDETIRNGSSLQTWFNIGAGTVGTTNANHTASIVNEGDGWYRCIVTLTVSIAGTGRSVFFRVAETDNSVTVTDDEGFIHVWEAKLEQRDFLLPAVVTTTTQPITRYQRQLKTAAANEWPREFDPVTGECLGRSVWESRTNLLLRSEEFDNAYWTKTRSSILANQIIAPDGTLSMDKLVENTDNNNHFLERDVTGLSSGATHTYSVFLKAAERSMVRISRAGGAVASAFNLSTGTVTNAAGSTGVLTNLGNGIFRCSITFAIIGTSTNVYLELQTSSSTSSQLYAGDGTSGIYIWGAMLESGAFASPYTPTVAAQVTRVADSAVMTGVNFSSWFNPSEGTFVMEVNRPEYSNFNNIFVVDDGSTANRMYVFQNSTVNRWRGFGVYGGSTQFDFSPTNTVELGQKSKISMSFATNNFAMCVDGGAVVVDSSGVIPAVTTFRIGNITGGDRAFNAPIKSIRYYPQSFTAANLQAITR